MLSLSLSVIPLTLSSVCLLLNLPLAIAHGSHEQAPLDPNETDWATRHMQAEHHISNFDARSFFLMHDFDSDGYWEESEIGKTYGFYNQESYTDDSSQTKKHISEEEMEKAIDKIIHLYDTDDDGLIDMDEWLEGIKNGKRLPDLGYGPGHHGDDEYEYEIHHFERYHNADSPEEEFNHPEDIRHMQRHEHLEREARSQETIDKMIVIDSNIPAKFRRA